MYANVKITKIIVGLSFLRKPAEAPLLLVELDFFMFCLIPMPRSSLATKPCIFHMIQYDPSITAQVASYGEAQISYK